MKGDNMQADTHGDFIPGKTRIKYGGAMIDDREINAIKAVLDRNWWTIDEEAQKFEEELAAHVGAKYAVYTNSGSSALLVGMSALDLPAGSKIIMPAVNFPTLVSAAIVNRYEPVFIDVDPRNLFINIHSIEALPTSVLENVKAIALVNIAGNIGDYEDVINFAHTNGMKVIVDNCDGFGTMYKGKSVEAWADVSATSFHAAHIITTGEGGAMFCNDDRINKLARSFREWGRVGDSDLDQKFEGLPEDYPARYTYITRGFNLKPIELQAAMGRVQLTKLDAIKAARKHNHDRLLEGLMKYESYLQLPYTLPDADVSWFAFPITVKVPGLRPKLRKFLEEKNIETRVIFAGNIIRQPAYKEGYEYSILGTLDNAENVLNQSFFISTHPSITDEMIDYVIESFGEFFKKEYVYDNT
jgi:CDP-6-deoxy-D-xylo-4-hexulose-3-dehydrase